MHAILTALALFAAVSTVTAEQTDLSFYSGSLSTGESRVIGNDPGGAGVLNFLTGWSNLSASPEFQYGMRVTWWQNDAQGWGLDFDSSAVQANQNQLAANGVDTLNLSNGVNLLTVNAFRRWSNAGALRPYVGAGVGVAIPKVEYGSGSGQVSQLQLTGPAVQWIAGASYPVGKNLSVFGEYKGSYSLNSIDLNNGGGLSVPTQSNGINVGVSLGF
ncbi:MAG: outer membrane beta-barrel protein [Paracoccaceae bacterium]